MCMEQVREISPGHTRVEYKLLLRRIKDLQGVSQVFSRFCLASYISIYSVSSAFASQDPSNMRGLLRQLNTWFHGEFRSIAEPALYARDDTTVVQATHKVSAMLVVVPNIRDCKCTFFVQAAGQVAVKVTLTDDIERYKRAKRELNLFRMFHGKKHICNMITGTAVDAAHGISARCACVFPFYALGTVQDLLKSGKPEFTQRLPAAAHPCLLFKHAVDMAKDILAGLECMHQMRIVHRDIKPGNICVELLPSTDQPRLRYIIIDLGAAVSVQVQPAVSESKSESSALAMGFTGQYTSLPGLKIPLGTVPFMSPEHIDERRVVDARSDVFSFGVTIYVCLCGRFPFVQPLSASDDSQLAMMLIATYLSANEADPLSVPCAKATAHAVGELVEVVMKSLRKLPKERYQSASEMQAQIERIDRSGRRCLGLCVDISLVRMGDRCGGSDCKSNCT